MTAVQLAIYPEYGPAKEAIALHGACTELALGFLGLEDVADYLQRRFALGSSATARIRSYDAPR